MNLPISPWFRLLLAGSLASSLLLGSGCASPESSSQAHRTAAKKPRHLLLVTIDTLRADHLGCYGYRPAQTPNLDSIAARGLRFTQATTVMPLTLPAHSSLLTGTYPAFHGVRDNGGFYLGEEQLTLAEILKAEGYRTGGFVGAFVLDSRWGIAQGFDRFFDDFDLTEFDGAPGMDAIQRPGALVVDQALEWLAEDVAEPFFAWVHLYDPHTPYEAPEPFRSRFPQTRTGAYDAEIAAADSQVGRLLESLEQSGRLQETLVVVMADHGEMLGEHEELTHGFFIYDGAVRIPWLMAGPGLPPLSLDSQVRIIDAMPTMLAQLEIEAPKAMQGVDLTPLIHGEGRRLVALSESWFPRYHYGWSELQSIQDGRYKFIRAPQRELYDLAADPMEANNLALQDSPRADAMEAALERLLSEVSAATERAPKAIDPETEEKLRALGYLGSSTKNLRPQEGPRGDPKQKIGLYNLMKQATAAASMEYVETAIAKMQSVLAQDSEIVEAYVLLGNFHRGESRFEDAVEEYRQALERNPEHREALYSLALAYKELGDYGAARLGLEQAAALDPRNGKVLWQTADLEMRQGHFQAAEAPLLQALRLDLDKPRFLLKLGECYLELGREKDALRRLDEALNLNTRLLTANYSRGLAFEGLGQPAAASAAYQAELALNQEAFRARFNLAKLLLKEGQAAKAIQLFRQTVEQRPRFGTGYLYLAKALLDGGALEEVEKVAQEGLANDPEPAVAPLGYLVLADLYHRQGRKEEAERAQREAQKLRLGL